MGYRALLKNYLRHLLRVAGGVYLDEVFEDEALSKRDIAELRMLTAEVEREELRRECADDGAAAGNSAPRAPGGHDGGTS